MIVCKHNDVTLGCTHFRFDLLAKEERATFLLARVALSHQDLHSARIICEELRLNVRSSCGHGTFQNQTDVLFIAVFHNCFVKLSGLLSNV